MSITTFLAEIEQRLKHGNATEHTYRSALEHLFQTVIPGATAINEPKRVAYGAPDLLIEQHHVPIGHVEAKAIGVDLGKAILDSERDTPKTPNGIQLKRYRAALPNLLYTDGLEWHWFVDGVPRLDHPVCIATWERSKNKLIRSKTASSDLTTLLEQFAAQEAELVGTPRQLAQRLAQIARWLNDVMSTILTTSGPHGSLHQQLDAFRHTLLPTITPAEFADMYAQTLVYGLFAARVVMPDRPNFSRLDAAHAIPETNPFLRQMFYQFAGINMDARIAWLVDDCTRLLERTNMSEVLRDFGKATQQEDPVVHFYETFLAAYDPKTREMRGVYYTPEPVVSYIVRSVDLLLQSHFDRPMGIAEDNTIILDPATGTATFLHAVVQHIYDTLQSAGFSHMWNQYVPDKLLPRLFGFELLMAPYTMAHLKLSLLLKELHYDFSSDKRLGIYLTNALSDAPTGQQAMPFAQFIAEEGKQADEVKHNKSVMVVLGNPPYSGHSANKSVWIDDLLHGILPDGSPTENYYSIDGKSLGERNPKWLQDDYVKFIRFGHWRITQTGAGILAFISNNGYLDNPTFRGMRESLLHDFDTIYILNLHGNSNKGEHSPDGSPDENVFDIQQGVTITIFVKQGRSKELATVYYADVWGKRQNKYDQLKTQDVNNTDWQNIHPIRPLYLFVPQDTALRTEYEQGKNIIDIFPINSVGIVTARDHLTIQWNQHNIETVVKDFVSLPEEEARTKYALGNDVRDWKVAWAQQDIQHHKIDPSYITPILYRPFDQRYTYYTGQTRGFLCFPRYTVMQHMIRGPNIGCITTRQTRDQWDALATDVICGHKSCSAYDISSLFPLYLYPNGNEHPDLFDYENGRRPNFSASFIKEVEQHLSLSFIPDGSGDLSTTIGPEDLFHYIYAVFHHPTYRTRYAEFLKREFPRVPLTSDPRLFHTVATYGAHLVDLHLLRWKKHDENRVCGAGGCEMLAKPWEHGVTHHHVSEVNTIRYDESQERVYTDREHYFAGIAPAVWTMNIGGYQPLHKWLKDRKGRTLAMDEVQHYMRMVLALRETHRIVEELAVVVMDVSQG